MWELALLVAVASMILTALALMLWLLNRPPELHDGEDDE